MPGGMGFRFSEDRRQPLLTMYGLLFDELGKLKDALAMRQELTERQLKALADPNRLRIIRSLRGGERFARQLSDELGLTPATVSHHLNILLVAFLVGSRLEGRNVYYRLNNKGLAGLAEDLRKLAGDVKEDRDDA
ncbi:MAG: ArsR/SmtB family transcription factor [Christensenellales bacterium]|jgi:DNA-binding transcriptional ArsR family regulator|nr:winged helix-turn-helix transcriptional regulator [Clostridiales bacterium]